MIMQLLFLALPAQPPAITEVMANPLDEDNAEFIEICNSSPLAVDLLGYSITDGDAIDVIEPWDETAYGVFPDTDAVTGSTTVPAGGYAVLLETGYVLAPAYDFPPGTVILTTGDAALCNGLAAPSDPLTLFDPAGTADSNAVSTYGTPVPSDIWSERDDDGLDGVPFDPGDGYSVERSSASMPDEESSWVEGPPGGTPGAGCGSQGGPDLSCTGVSASDQQPGPGAPFTASAVFLYAGPSPCPAGTLSLFVDFDADSLPGAADIILATADAAGMLPGSRDTVSAPVSLETGWFCITGLSECVADTLGQNDASSVCVSPGGGVPPVMTEVMANPADEDCDEFIEILYTGPGAYPLSGSSLTDGDALDTVVPWQGVPPPGMRVSQWLPSGGVALVIDPEYVLGSMPYDPPESTVVATVANTTIGSGLTADDPVTLYGPWGTGSGDVQSTYGTPVPSEDPLQRDDDGLDGIPFDPGDGFSVERIHPAGPDAEFNWQASASGGSPGVAPESPDTLDLCVAGIVIIPAVNLSRAETVTLEAFVYNCGSLPAAGAVLEFFVDLDADSSSSPGEVQAALAVPYSMPGQTDTLSTVIDLADGCWLLGATSLLAGDADPSNDTALGAFSSGECPAPAISEVVCNPVDEDTDEYVELWFPGPGVFDIEGCRICDGDALDLVTQWSGGDLADPDASPGRFVPPGSHAVILDPEYAQGAQPWDFAPGTVVATVSNTTLGDGLAGTDPVLLYSAAGTGTSCVLSTYGTPLLSDDPLSCDDDGLDSIPFNPGEGLAVHRIVPSGPDSESNWVASDPTPGGDPPGVETGLDFSPVALDLEPPFGEDGTMVSLSARVANLGAEQASQGELEVWLYEDLDFSGSPSPSEIILSLLPDPPAPGDSVEISTAWPAPGTAMTVGIYTVCAGDTTVSDDSLSMIWNRPCDIVINEIMYHPAPGDPEWIELSNSSADSLDMAGLILSDSREEVLVTDSSIVIAPGAFVIVASDSSAFREVWPGLDCPVIEPPSWPALNDQTQPGEGYADDVRLTLPGGQGADMVPYDDSWGGGAGISLEKTDPGARGWLPGSWSSCTGDATPGTQNSVYSPGSGPQGFLSYWPDPFSPDGDGMDDVLTITVQGGGEVSLEVFNVQGRSLLVLADGAPSGGQFTAVWDGLDADGGRLPVGRYIILARLEKPDGEVREKAAVVVLARHL